MSDKTRAFFLSLSIVALLVFSAVGTIPVYADDGTTTGSTDTTTTTTGTDLGDTSVTGDVPPPEIVTPPLLEQLPENTTVTVVDAAGDAQPLASQDSAEAVLLSDPIWCPAGQVPTPGENGCTASFTSFTELLTYLQANETDVVYQQAGTIYVQQGAYLGGEESIDFNSYNFTNLNQQDLTLQGGWDTTDNSVDPADTSQFTVPIIIGSSSNPWVGSLTLNNLIINGVGDQTGLTLYSQGDIDLSNVEVTNSQNGADVNAGGNVTVKNSKFNNNGSGVAMDINGTNIAVNSEATGSGLYINGGGAVTLQDVEANNNQLFGANITAAQTVTVTNGFFNGNVSYAFPPTGSWEHYGYGLQVVTTQNIVLDNVNANGNQLFGANLDGSSVAITNGSFNDNGSLFDEDPVGYGLKITSSGNVTLLSVAANNNELFGADIEAGGSVDIQQSFFNGNSSFEYVANEKVYNGYGLKVVTIADIVLRVVSADGNSLLGAHLEGSDIAVRESSFSNNGSGSGLDVIGKGLEIVGITDPSFGNGNVALRDVVADNNQLFGANIQTTGDVAIAGINSFSGHITYVYDSNTGNVLSISGGYGLQVVATGNIALRGITANGNYRYGASLDGFDVAVSDSIFSNNGSGVLTLPAGFGVKINSKGSVAINNIEANLNQLFGADIVAVGDVSILTGFFSGNQSVAVDPCNGLTFYGYGLTVYSGTGDVTLDGVEANFNNLWGGSLDGLSVFVVNSKFNNNVSDSTQFIDDTGLIINSRGDFVFLNNVEAKENRLIGATITAVGDVYITNSTFTGNAGITCLQSWCPPGSEVYHGYGLNVVTPGLISLDFVTASDNNLFGAHLEGSTVSVSNSSFNNNGTGTGNTPLGRGLEIVSGGPVTLSLIEANNNQLFGANVQAVGDVTVTASDFVGNFHIVGTTPQGYGLQVITLGNITLNSNNTGYGVQSYQNGSGAILQGNNILVTDSNFYNNGSGNGLTINATGTVTLTNVTATANGQNGVDITTAACAIVQVNGGTFSNNGQYGLSVNGGILNADGTQVFAGNGAGNIFQNSPTCAIVLSVTTTPLVTNSTVVTGGSNTSTTVSTGTTNNNTTVSNNKKIAKVKKANVKKYKMVRYMRIRRAR